MGKSMENRSRFPQKIRHPTESTGLLRGHLPTSSRWRLRHMPWRTKQFVYCSLTIETFSVHFHMYNIYIIYIIYIYYIYTYIYSYIFLDIYFLNVTTDECRKDSLLATFRGVHLRLARPPCLGRMGKDQERRHQGAGRIG